MVIDALAVNLAQFVMLTSLRGADLRGVDFETLQDHVTIDNFTKVDDE